MTWVRKSAEQIAGEEEKRLTWRKFRWAMPVGFGSAFVVFALRVLARPGDEAQAAVVALAVGAALFYLTHRIESWLAPRVHDLVKPPIMICTACHRRGLSDGQRNCACGGALEPLRFWRQESAE